MTIEKLAEIVNQQWNFGTPFRRTAKEWQAFCESTAQAIATAVLAEPTSDEAVRFAKEYETNIQNREGFQATPAAQAGLKLFLSDRLASLTQSKQPVDASKADVSEDEVERVAEAIEQNGVLCQPFPSLGAREKEMRLRQARAALSAMNRGERWGVWSNEAWAVDRLTGKHITSCDKDVLRTLCRVWNENENYQWAAEVRPYPSTPQVQVPEEAVEAGAESIYTKFLSYDHNNNKTYPWVKGGNSMKQDEAREYARTSLTAALPHLQRGVTK